MRSFTREERALAFDKLPKEVKSFVMSEEAIAAFQEIGRGHKLSIESIGVMSDIIMLFVLGMLPAGDFEKELQDNLRISPDAAQVVAQEVNEKILLKVRDAMQGGQIPPKSTPTSATNEGQPSKEDILAEIEDPTPSVHPISAAVPPTPPARPSDDHFQTQTSTQAAAQEVAHDFIGGKFAEPVSLPTKKATVDPYREPIA